MPKNNISCQKFNRLLVLNENGRDSCGSVLWNCRCDCGKEIIVRGSSLISGHTKSCGCYNRDLINKKIKTHGQSAGLTKATTEYKTWNNIIQRCHNPKTGKYIHYGGRGISVCNEWRCSFETFFNDMGKKPNGFTLERIDVNGNYCKENCIWANWETQSRNRSNNVWLECNGIKMIKADWAKYFNVSQTQIYKRMKKGQSFEYIFNYYKNKTKQSC